MIDAEGHLTHEEGRYPLLVKGLLKTHINGMG